MDDDDGLTLIDTEPLVERGRVLRILSSVGFWVALAFAIQGFVIVWLFVVTGDRRRDAALHRGEVIADARSKVNQCIVSRPALVKINRFLQGEIDFHDASLKNARDVLALTAKDDPSYAARKRIVARIIIATRPVKAIRFPIPTIPQCLALGTTRYGVVPPTVPLHPKPPAKPKKAKKP